MRVPSGEDLKRDLYWDLDDDKDQYVAEKQRAERAQALRFQYARVDPKGWDARRLTEEQRLALFGEEAA